MEKELREKAEKRVKAKQLLYVLAVIFSCTSVILLMLSLYLPGAAVWLLLPIPAFIMVLGIIFISAYGPPTSKGLSENWEEEAIEREMKSLRRQKKTQLPPLEDLSETEILELKELERLQNKWDAGRDEDYV